MSSLFRRGRLAAALTLALAHAPALLSAQTAASHDACAALTPAQLKAWLGVEVEARPASPAARRCVFQSGPAARTVATVTIQYVDFHNEQTADNMLKAALDESSKAIAAGKKAVGVYETVKPVAAAGPNAHYLAGKGSDFTGGAVTRVQFAVGGLLINVDTQGIDPAVVAAHANDICAAVKAKSGA